MRPQVSIATAICLNALIAIDWFLVQEIHEGWWDGGSGCCGVGLFLTVQLLVHPAEARAESG
jgi:hypothetical protein